MRIHQWVEGVEEVEECQHQKQIESVVIEYRKCRSLSVCHFILLPRNTTPENIKKSLVVSRAELTHNFTNRSSFSALVSFLPEPELRSARTSFDTADSRFIEILHSVSHNTPCIIVILKRTKSYTRNRHSSIPHVHVWSIKMLECKSLHK